MASRTVASTALLLSLNLLFFTLVSSTYCPPPPSPKPKVPKPHPDYPPPAPSSTPAKCPEDTLKLGVCVDLLNDLLNVKIGEQPRKEPCCSLIGNLVALDAAVCLCTTIKANILGIINLNLPVHLNLLLNTCGKKAPEGYKCS